MKDYLNKEIEEGDTIVYPGRKGSDLWISKAVVSAVTPTEINIITEDNKLRTIRRVDRVAVVEKVEVAHAGV